jgi:hypothetical protein
MGNSSPDQVTTLLLFMEAVEIVMLIIAVLLLFLLWRVAISLRQWLREVVQQPAAVRSILANPSILKAHPEVLRAIADHLSELPLEEVLAAQDRKRDNEQ